MRRNNCCGEISYCTDTLEDEKKSCFDEKYTKSHMKSACHRCNTHPYTIRGIKEFEGFFLLILLAKSHVLGHGV